MEGKPKFSFGGVFAQTVARSSSPQLGGEQTGQSKPAFARRKLLPNDGIAMQAKRKVARRSAAMSKAAVPSSSGVSTHVDRNQILHQLADLRGTHCPTVANRYHVLMKRDELMCKLRIKNTDVKKARVLSSTCPDMCPEKDRYMRELQKLLNEYECDHNGQLIPEKAIKDYARSAADQEEPLPHELRAPEALKKTMSYLIHEFMQQVPPHGELPKWYDFLWTRTRSIRKEITQQMLTNSLAVDLVECCTRFHIYASFAMINFEEPQFNARLNTENLSKCLQTLRHLYDDLSKKGIFCENEPEFRSYDVLLNLADSNVLSIVRSYRDEVRKSPHFLLAVQLVCAYQSNNYVAFFRKIQLATFMQTCLCYNSVIELRLRAADVITRTSRPVKFPVASLASILGFSDEQECRQFCKEYNILDEMEPAFIKRPADSPDQPDRTVGANLVREKMYRSLSEMIAGKKLELAQFPVPINSFTPDGYYENDPVLNDFLKENNVSLSNVRRRPSEDETNARSRDLSPLAQRKKDTAMVKPGDPLKWDKPGAFSVRSDLMMGNEQNGAKPLFKSLKQPNGIPVPPDPSAKNGLAFPSAGLKPIPEPPKESSLKPAFKFDAPAQFSAFQPHFGQKPGNPPPFTFKPNPSTSTTTIQLDQKALPTLGDIPTKGSNGDVSASFTMPLPKPADEELKLKEKRQAEELKRKEEEERRRKMAEEKQRLAREEEERKKTAEEETRRKRKEQEEREKREREQAERQKKLEEKKKKEANRKRKEWKWIKTQLPRFRYNFGNTCADVVLNACADDFLWLAAHKLREREAKINVLKEKRALRVVRPYFDKWVDLLRWRQFLRTLPNYNLDDSCEDQTHRKRSGIFNDLSNQPPVKKSKKAVPLFKEVTQSTRDDYIQRRRRLLAARLAARKWKAALKRRRDRHFAQPQPQRNNPLRINFPEVDFVFKSPTKSKKYRPVLFEDLDQPARLDVSVANLKQYAEAIAGSSRSTTPLDGLNETRTAGRRQSLPNAISTPFFQPIRMSKFKGLECSDLRQLCVPSVSPGAARACHWQAELSRASSCATQPGPSPGPRPTPSPIPTCTTNSLNSDQAKAGAAVRPGQPASASTAAPSLERGRRAPSEASGGKRRAVRDLLKQVEQLRYRTRTAHDQLRRAQEDAPLNA